MAENISKVEALIKTKKFKEAIEIAKKEAEADKDNEYVFRSMIGEAILKDY